uniref:Lipocalin n=1 Tax=Rhipicephalus zambeziensis TaxID=60191 RepID=A0A224YCE6_9ACAR
MMATLPALILSVLAVAEAYVNVSELIDNQFLNPYQDPSRFIANKSDIYLLRASVLAGTASTISQTPLPCVRSRYWSNRTRRAERSFDVYSKTNESDYESINISLTVQKEPWKTILHVDPNGKNMSVIDVPYMNTSTFSAHLNRTFLVLYSDVNCLILADQMRRGNRSLSRLYCSMWLTENRIRRPPKCCQFIFELLCAYYVDSVTFFEESCLNNRTTA